MIIYFCFAIIDLINNYKNVYSRNVCIIVFIRIVCIMVFMKIVYVIVFSFALLVCDCFLCILLLFLVLKRVMSMFEISVIFAGIIFNMIINLIIF